MARPMPRLPPVTIATRPSRSNWLRISLRVRIGAVSPLGVRRRDDGDPARAGAPDGARGPGLRRPAPHRPDRPAPRASGVRPRRADPDRLRQRARPVAGAPTVRASRSAPPRPAAQDARRRRAVRVLGPRGVVAADRDAAVVPLDDELEVHPLARAAAD